MYKLSTEELIGCIESICEFIEKEKIEITEYEDYYWEICSEAKYDVYSFSEDNLMMGQISADIDNIKRLIKEPHMCSYVAITSLARVLESIVDMRYNNWDDLP